jgi:hypothetical protein
MAEQQGLQVDSVVGGETVGRIAVDRIVRRAATARDERRVDWQRIYEKVGPAAHSIVPPPPAALMLLLTVVPSRNVTDPPDSVLSVTVTVLLPAR